MIGSSNDWPWSPAERRWEALAARAAVTACAAAVVYALMPPSAPHAVDEASRVASALLSTELSPE